MTGSFPAFVVVGKASTISAQIAAIAARWDGRYIPPSDADGFSLHIPARPSKRAPERAGVAASSLAAPVRTQTADAAAALCRRPNDGGENPETSPSISSRGKGGGSPQNPAADFERAWAEAGVMPLSEYVRGRT